MIEKLNVIISMIIIIFKIKIAEYFKKYVYTYNEHFSVPVSQVAAAASAVTGAPLHVATPMAPYIPHYPQAHPQTFQGSYAHAHMVSYIELFIWLAKLLRIRKTIFLMKHMLRF